MPNELQDLIDGSLSQRAITAKFAAICGNIARQTDAEDERILHRSVQVDGFVKNNGAGTTGITDEDINAGEHRELISGDENKIRQVIRQIRSLDDVVVFTFNTSNQVVSWINEQLAKHSPYLTGRYMRGHVVFGDGELINDLRDIDHKREIMSDVKEWTFVNKEPYSRKIEEGESQMAPHGVYELVANLAQKQFPWWQIEFIDYVGSFDGVADSTKKNAGARTKRRFNKSSNRYPAIRAFVPSLGEERIFH